MASSSHGELGALKSTKKQKKTKKKTRTQSKARSSESAEIEALEGNTEDQRVGLIENDESELFTNLCQGAAASNDACQYAECADANAKENLGTEPNHGCCSCFWDCLPTWLTKPNFYYTKNDDLDDFGVLKEIPKKRLLKIWEIFSAIDTDMDGQIDIAEVRRFFYHLGAASRDDRCRVRIAAEFDHPKGLPLVKGKDFLDALAEEPLETLKVSGWIRSFGSSFLSQISSGEASGSEDAGSTGSVQPISNTKDIDDEPDRRSLTGFWQFAASPLCQPTDSEDSIDLVNEFRAVASQQRWGRFRSWKFAKAIERFRQYNAACQTKRERSRMERILGLNLSRPDLITIALNFFSAFSSVLDVYTDAVQENGFFANGRNACLGFLLAGWFGPIYLAILELPLLSRDILWAPITCLLAKGTRDKGEMVWSQIFHSLGIVDGTGYRKQRAMAQLLFETIPQLLIQFMVVEGMIQAQDLVESDRETIARSLVLAALSLGFSSTSVQSLISVLCRQTEEDGHSAVWKRLRNQKYGDSKRFRLQKIIRANHAQLLGEPQVFSFAEDLECDLLQVEKGSYYFYKKHTFTGTPCESDEIDPKECLIHHDGIDVFLAKTSVKLGPFGDGGSSSSRFKFVLGSSCERLCLQEIVQLILACWGRVSIDFSGVDWRSVLKTSRSLGLLLDTHDQGDPQWQASMPDGEPVLSKCLLLGQPHAVGDPEQEKFDLHNLAKDLLFLNANPNVKDTMGQSLLLSCVAKKKARAVQLLLSHDVDVSKDVLQKAVQNSTVDVVQCLLMSDKCLQIQFDGKDKSLCGLACSRLKDACVSIEKALGGEPALQIGALFEAVDILKILSGKNIALPVAEVGLALECEAALCLCQFHEGHHPLLKDAVEQALMHSIVVNSENLLNKVTQEGDTMFHLLGKKAPLRHGGLWKRMNLWLEKYPEHDLTQYVRLKNKAGLLALEVALESSANDGIDHEDSNILSWLFEQTRHQAPSEQEGLLQRCVDTLCKRAKSHSLNKEQISRGISFVLGCLYKSDAEFSKSCFTEAAKKLEEEKSYRACEHLVRGAASLPFSEDLAPKCLREQGWGAPKKEEKQGEAPKEHSAHQFDDAESARVIGKKQIVQSSHRYVRQALDAKFGEGEDSSNDMSGMKMILQGLVIVLEILSAADLFTDVLLVRWMYLSHHIWWATLSCLMMVAPYLAAFSATLRIGLRNRIFEATDSNGKMQKLYRLRRLAGAVCMTPLCVVAFILLDLVYTIKAATFDVFALVVGLIAPKMKLDVTDGAVSKFLSDHLGLTTMDIEGYRRLRTTTQLLFESFPQIVLQLYILLKSSSEREVEVSDEELIVSLAFALFHLFATCCIVWLEARAAREPVARYTMTCLTGRLGWLPFADTANLSLDEGKASQQMHFDDLSFLSACGRFTMAFEFSQSTWTKLLGALSKVQDKTSNIHVAFGPSISLMNIHDILNFQKRFSKVKTSMQSGKEPVPWTKVLRNSGFSLQSGKVCISDREQAETRKLLEDFMSNHNHEAVRALLEAGVSIAGLTSRGLLYLTLAVELRSAKICELFLNFNAPLTSADLPVEIKDPLIEGGFRVRSTLETPLEAAFRVLDPDIISVFLFHERIQATSSMRQRALQLAEEARRANRAEDAKKYAHASGLAPSWDQVTSTKVRLLLGGEPIGSTIECNVAELQCFDLFREKLFPVRDHETKEEALKKIFNTAVDGFLEVDLTFVKRMFPKSDLSPVHLQHLLAVIREPTLPENVSLGILDGLVEELGLVQMQKFLQVTAPYRVRQTMRKQQATGKHASYRNSPEERALVILSVTLPPDCWRVSGMRISGKWTDQGWGNTDINKVELRATTARAGLVHVQLHSVDWKSDDDRIEVNFGGETGTQGFDEEGRKTLDREEAESLLEVLTGNDLIQVTMGCVGWSGHEGHAEDTCLDIDYFTHTF
ncbi:Uncharacterized protein SCF082_LOCUS7350 [Durusdinium trenchii]|uniref:EF-hand domain-containing protein n=1 Tax=Durusdinium trenchii TaxID=1381693 RepID=A0ABP0IIM7_9DINO